MGDPGVGVRCGEESESVLGVTCIGAAQVVCKSALPAEPLNIEEEEG